MGTYVFNIATDNLEDDLDQGEQQEPQPVDLTFLETAAREATAQSTPNKDATPQTSAFSPIEKQMNDFVILTTTRNVPAELRKRIEPRWREKPLTVRKFVDDNLQTDKVHMQMQETYQEGNTTFKNPRVIRTEQMFNHIATRAKTKGLVVNAEKTNLLVVSASKSYEARAHFYDSNNQRINSQNNLKALGFIFNQRGDASSQVDNLCTKFRQKVWSLRHLRKSGFSEPELLTVYKTYLRPTLEYSAPIYHSMITAEQEHQLEKQQYFALKNIYGFVYSHNELLQMSGLETLKERRMASVLKFAQKTAANTRFKNWFPLRRTRGRNAGGREEYVEMNARTDRRKNSPIFHYRRVLNEHRIDYDVRNMARSVPLL